METNEQYYNNYEERYSPGNNMNQFRERYSQRGNYYGMQDGNKEYGNVRIQQRHDFNDFSNGPAGGYGGNYNDNYNRVHNNHDDHYRYGDDSNFRQSHGYSAQSDYRNDDYNRNRAHGQQNYTEGQQYSTNYDVAGNRRYARQENSYENPGHGRRYSEYGQDERRNFGHDLTDIHHDRGSHKKHSYENNYRSENRPSDRYDFEENKEDYRFKGRIVGSGSGQYRDQNNRGPRPSGPDYSKISPIGSYGYETFGI